MIELPNKKKCYNLPEQVAQNLLNITYLAEQYKNIDALPAIWAGYKETFDTDIATFGEWTTTFEGWETTLATYLANMSSAAVGAIAGQNIAPANINATGNIGAPSIIETMTGYSFTVSSSSDVETIYAGVVKNGNKLTFVFYGKITPTSLITYLDLGSFSIPEEVNNKLYTTNLGGNNYLDIRKVAGVQSASVSVDCMARIEKGGGVNPKLFMLLNNTTMTLNTPYLVRYEATFLLSDNLAA